MDAPDPIIDPERATRNVEVVQRGDEDAYWVSYSFCVFCVGGVVIRLRLIDGGLAETPRRDAGEEVRGARLLGRDRGRQHQPAEIQKGEYQEKSGQDAQNGAPDGASNTRFDHPNPSLPRPMTEEHCERKRYHSGGQDTPVQADMP